MCTNGGGTGFIFCNPLMPRKKRQICMAIGVLLVVVIELLHQGLLDAGYCISIFLQCLKHHS